MNTEDLEGRLRKRKGMMLGKALLLSAALAGSYWLGNLNGHNQEYNKCTAQQISFENNVKKHNYQDIQRVDDNFFLARYEGHPWIIDREGNSRTGQIYDEIKTTKHGFECKWRSFLGMSYKLGIIDDELGMIPPAMHGDSVFGVYVNYLNTNMECDSTKSFTIFPNPKEYEIIFEHSW